MSLHSSLKTKSGALNQHRNVLTRTERISKLMDLGSFVEGKDSPLGIPKVRSIKITAGKKKKAAPKPGEEGDSGDSGS